MYLFVFIATQNIMNKDKTHITNIQFVTDIYKKFTSSQHMSANDILGVTNAQHDVSHLNSSIS